MKALSLNDKTVNEKKRAEARAIGQTLFEHGGSERMTLIAYRVQAIGGSARDCEWAWDGIGDWMA